MVTSLAMMPMPVNIEQGHVVKRKPAGAYIRLLLSST